MLTITPEASEAIRGILDADSTPDGALIRISTAQPQDGNQGGAPLAISVVESAAADDRRIEGDSVEVAVEPATAALLDDKQLDATVSGGQVSFTIGDQDQPGGEGASG
jgi:Fe-S cluster assembly iron-binding protein IscA